MFLPSRIQRRSFIGNKENSKTKISLDNLNYLIKKFKSKDSPYLSILITFSENDNDEMFSVHVFDVKELSKCQDKWPKELFSSIGLCYGMTKVYFKKNNNKSLNHMDKNNISTKDDLFIERFENKEVSLSEKRNRSNSIDHNDNTFSLLSKKDNYQIFYISFCWEGNSLPVSLRSKMMDYNHSILRLLNADAHFTLNKPEQLSEISMKKQIPNYILYRKGKKNSFINTNGMIISKNVYEICEEIQERNEINANFIICSLQNNQENDTTISSLILIDKGISSLETFSERNEIVQDNTNMIYKSILKYSQEIQSKVFFIYLRIDIPFQQRLDQIISKFVLITYKINNKENNTFESANLYAHSKEIYHFFRHHVHIYATNDRSIELTDVNIKEKVRNSINNDNMLLRLIYLNESREFEPSLCTDFPFIGTLNDLKKIVSYLYAIKNEEQIFVYAPIDHCKPNQKAFSCNITEPYELTNDNMELRKDYGIQHGDVIYLMKKNKKLNDSLNSKNILLLKLKETSFSAERRKSVQYNIKTRENELLKSIIRTKNMILNNKKNHKYDNNQIGIPPRIVNSSNENSTEITDEEKILSGLKKKLERLEKKNDYLDISYNCITIFYNEILGNGKNATVYRGIWTIDQQDNIKPPKQKNNVVRGAEVAVKVLRYVKLSKTLVENYLTEIGNFRQLKHANIVLFIGCCISPKLILITEYCARGSLYSILENKKIADTVPWKFMVRMMLDAARGIEYLHSVRMIHRDIKSHNLLVDDEWRCKVADFGISKVLASENTAFTQCGTSGWVAPEVLADEEVGYTFKADNWSFAIVMWEMVQNGNTNPFIGMAPVKFYRLVIEQNIRPKIHPEVDLEYAELIKACWNSNPLERPSFVNIVKTLENILIKLDMSIEMPHVYDY